MLFSKCIIAFVPNDFRVLQRFLSRGMTFKDSTFIAEFRELMCLSVVSIKRQQEMVFEFL